MQLDNKSHSLVNSNNKNFPTREVEAAIRSSLTVSDCVVIERQTEKFKQELVAYVVPSGLFAQEQLLCQLQKILPSEWMPTAIVPVSTLPLTPWGEIDETALSHLEIRDTDLVQRWEEQIQSLLEIKQVAVVVQEQVKHQQSLRLSELLPEWKTFTREEINPPVRTEFSHSTNNQISSSSKLAISHGGELKREKNAPTLLSQVLQKTAIQSSEKELGLVYIQSDGSEIIQSYQDLLLDAQKILAGLRKLGLKPLDKIIFQIDQSQDFIPAFWGCVLGGFIPVPISLAPTYEQVNSSVSKLHNAWQMLKQPLILTSARLAPSIRELPALLNIENFQVETVDNLRQNQPDSNIHQSQSDDLALLLLTSGSTGFPKAVMLNHRNLLSMTAATAQMNNFSSQDITLNWMPLEHVGAIVFLGLMAVDLGCQQIHVSTEYILQNPIRWLELIHRHKASISWAPNFAFSLLNERYSEINQRSWDLSSMRFLVNAGEQIVPKTARSFLKLLQQHGLPSNAIHPAFGMSETCSGITWSDGFSLENSSDEMSFVELGPPIPGASIRITDDNNQIVAEGVIGRFQVKGLSVTSGYYENPDRNREAFTEDGWFNTGDIGYLQSGRIVLTGRDKDDIIINGVNYYSHEIESVVEEVEGVEVSYTAACAVRSGDNADQLAIFFSPAVSHQTLVKEIIKKIRGSVVKNIGVNPNYIIPVKKEVIPKTAIGKIQRAQLSRMFADGEFDSIIQELGINLDNPNLLPDWFYRQTWRRKLPVTQMSAINGHFLVFLDQLGLGECLGAELQKQGQAWVGIEAGVDFKQLSNNRYQIAPNNPEHYQRLLSVLTANNFPIDKIVHLWTYDSCISEISSLESLSQAQTRVYSLLSLIKALANIQKSHHPLELLVVSNYTQFTSPADEIAYEKSPLLGLLKVISQEIAGLTCRHVDLTLDEPGVNAERILQEIHVLSRESEVAYRDGQRWIPRLEKVDFRSSQKQELPFKSGGMYLISGGLGGVGVEIAKYLLKHYKARLLLVGRTSLPEKSTWQTYIGQSNVISQKIAAYQELEQLGGEITYEAVDVCDLQRLQQVVAQTKSRWGCQLDGVLHLAGTYQQRSLIEESQESWSAALRSKVGGAWVLNQLLKDDPQAVFISFSSVSSFLGGATVGAFVAANQFLQSFAHYQRSKCGLNSYCFSWSLWDGIGISQDYQRSKLAITKGYCAINARQGLYSLLIGLNYQQVQLLVGLDGSNRHIRGHVEDTYSLEKLTAYFTASGDSSVAEGLSKLVVRDRFGILSTCNFVQLQQMPLTQRGIIDREKLTRGDLPEPANDQAQPVTDIERQVARIWQEVLGLEEVGIHDNFFELGGHSLLLAQAQSKLQDFFRIPLSIVDMFKYPTISTLAKYLSQGQTESPAVVQGQKRAQVRSSRQAANKSDIAVIGMSCRFPGANNIDEFWQNLCNGVESISFFSDEEIIATGVDPAVVKNPNYVKAKPILSDVESFDADFFGYSSKEAELIDPQQRLLLECAWESLEDAGYNPFTYDGAIGIYAGAVMNTYLLNNIYPNRHQLDVNDNLQVATVDSMGGLQMMVANDKDYLTTRISYKLNLTGPSVNVQTACSTSLVTIHMAGASLLSGESDMVLAGGVSVHVPQKAGHLYQEGMIVTPDGHCRAFDARAQGTIFGSGVGMVVLKRLEDAIADGDHIYAVIKGSAVNNDGGTKVGYMAPNGDGQAAVVTEAIAMAGVDAETITYVEAHGTGTPLGDPIEIGGLTQAFRASTQSKNFCGIGSVKTNVGHLQIASGVAGFIKTVLSLYHKKIPPSLHFEQPNPQLDLPNTPFYVNTTLQDWQTSDYPRRAGVNSLGIGGTNAHVILEEAPEIAQVKNEFNRPYHLLTLSVKNDQALAELRHRYWELLTTNAEVSIADICYTANTGREHFKHRLAIVADSREQLIEQLADLTSPNSAQSNNKSPKIAFLFTGQGSQYINMGRQLYDTQPIFRQTLEQCDEILRPYLDHSLLEVLYPSQALEQASSLLDQTAYTQPALFAIEYALYQLWKSWGIEPDVVMGHSVGEYVAATVAGVFSLSDGLKLIANRGQLMQQLPSGGEMVSLMASEERVRQVIAPYNGRVALAAINGSESVVISGAREDIAAVCQQLEALLIKTKRLQVSHAFHSPLMTPMLADFEAIANQVTYNQPQIPLVSNVTGKIADESITTAQYWVHHVCQTVRFTDSMETLHQLGYEVFLEIGPKPILLGMGHQCLPDSEGLWLPSLREGIPEWQQLLESLAKLYVQGVNVNWSGFEQDYPHRKVALPTYPFQRQRYWIENTSPRHQQQQYSTKLHPLIDKKLQLPLSKEILFESEFSTQNLPFLADYQVYNKVVVAAACHLSMILGAAKLTFANEACLLENIVFPQALAIPEDRARTVQLVLSLEESGASFKLISFDTVPNNSTQVNQWLVHATGKISQGVNTTPETVFLPQIQTRCTQQIPAIEIYQSWQKRQIQLGASFQWLDSVWCGEGEALAKLKWLSVLDGLEEYQLYPGLMDSCGQLSSIFFSDDETFVPFAIESFKFYQRPQSQQLWCHLVRSQSEKSDIRLFDANGQLIAEIKGFEASKATPNTLLPSLQQELKENYLENWLYEVEWHPQVRFSSEQLSPDYLPALAEISRKLQPQYSQLMAEPQLEVYQAAVRQLETLSIDYVLQALTAMGWKPQLGQRFTTTAIANQLGVVSQHQRLFKRLLEMLAEVGVLEAKAFEWQVIRQPENSVPQAKLNTLLTQYPIANAEFTLLGRCGSSLAQVLRGECDPLELIFPEKDSTTAQLYENSPLTKAMNVLAQETIVSLVEHLPTGRGLRILEIGAGTGGTTSYLLPHLPWEQTQYQFTDIGSFFIQKAQEKFQDFPFVKYQVLDIEKEPVSQGFEKQQYDVIVAANVLHATQDLQQTLKHTKQLLAPQGILILLETTQRQRWVDLIFGLTPGWWRFSDWQLRPDYPLISAAQWHEVLQETGFTGTVNLLPPQQTQSVLSRAMVMLAQVPPSPNESVQVEPRHWLLLADQQGIAQQLADKLATHSQLCTLVFVGEEYEQLDQQQFKINPSNPQHYQKLLQAINSKPLPLYGVVHCWSLDTVKAAELTAANLATASLLGCGSTLHLVQALTGANLSAHPRLWLVTQGAVAITNLEGVAQSSLWGMGKVIALEHPELNCVRVDLAPADAEIVQTLFEEIWFPTTEDQIAFTDQLRYVARLARYRKPENDLETAAHKPLSFREDSTYLIAGGMGGLGLLVARWMVQQGARHLVLIGRSGASGAVNEQLQELEQAGAQVIVAQADVSDVEQITKVLSEIEQTLPPLRGIIHSVGVLDDGVLQQQNWQRFAKVLAPKVQGAWHLHTLTQNQPLDFFVMFSSIASLLGNPGQSNHAAANAFLDALAYHRQTQGLAGLSINWGAWSQIGAFAQRQIDEQTKMQGIGTFTPEQGLVALEQLLSQSSAQVAVVPLNWSEFLMKLSFRSPFFANFTHTLAKKLEQSDFRTRLAAAKADERYQLLIDHICSQVAQVIGHNLSRTLDLQQGFLELGIDSLTALELRNRLQNSLGCSLPSTLVFDYPTITKLTDYLAKEVLSIEPSASEQQASDAEGDLRLSSDLSTALDELSESEIEKLLAQELTIIQESKGK